jgi:hypothetical protein
VTVTYTTQIEYNYIALYDISNLFNYIALYVTKNLQIVLLADHFTAAKGYLRLKNL